jgi:N6-adenosine-specific RNA methylase IME4
MTIFPDFGQRFGAIYADPPWRYVAYSAKGYDRSAVKHYPVMGLEAIKALPVGDIAAKDCVLFLWATWPNLLDALAVIEAWGFTYKTCAFCWAKTNADGSPYMGLGFWTRSNSEACLLATRGRVPRLNKDVRQIVFAPRGRHSAKPPEIRGRIERLVAGPYIELFARETAPGWTAWGDQVDQQPNNQTGGLTA